jgi:DNA polymerase I-like protein with 3'-5' exonuclease and polymerase domains
MLINVDAKALEWYAAVFLSQDKVGIEELVDGTIDQHSDNQRRLKLPSRLISKIFLFRLIFGGTAFAYASDHDFKDVGWNARKWQRAIDAFYEKYGGLEQWHNDLMNQVILSPDHSLVMPTGRIYTYEPYLKRGELIFPRTQILNYPVQGLGADLMTIARVSFFRRMRREFLRSKLISTVHDSILVDSPKEEVDKVCELLYNTWKDIPENFRKLFGVEFNLPMRCEIQIGPTWGNMEDYHAT